MMQPSSPAVCIDVNIHAWRSAAWRCARGDTQLSSPASTSASALSTLNIAGGVPAGILMYCGLIGGFLCLARAVPSRQTGGLKERAHSTQHTAQRARE